MTTEIEKCMLSILENIVKSQKYILKDINGIRDDIKRNNVIPFIVNGLKCNLDNITPGTIIPVHNSSFKTSSNNIVSRVIAGVIAALLIGAFTWVGDLLYEAPSPTQQKIIQKMALQIREYPSLHASNR